MSAPTISLSASPDGIARLHRVTHTPTTSSGVYTHAPSADAFVDEGGQPAPFLTDTNLDELASDLIQRFEELGHLASVDIAYLWKAKGGTSGETQTLGKCSKASGLLAHFSDVQFVIWLAADHCHTLQLAPRQIEALLYHELSHIGWDADKDAPVIRNHEFSGFVREVDRYGLWLDDLRILATSIKQLPLEGVAA